LNQIEVVAAAIIRSGQVLIAKKRPDQGHFTAGQWEFPGGKVEKEESKLEALHREIFEELGVEVRVVKFLASTSYLYRSETRTLHVHLFVFVCSLLGEIKAIEHEEIQWVAPDKLGTYDLSPADMVVVPAIIEAAITF